MSSRNTRVLITITLHGPFGCLSGMTFTEHSPLDFSSLVASSTQYVQNINLHHICVSSCIFYVNDKLNNDNDIEQLGVLIYSFLPLPLQVELTVRVCGFYHSCIHVFLPIMMATFWLRSSSSLKLQCRSYFLSLSPGWPSLIHFPYGTHSVYFLPLHL